MTDQKLLTAPDAVASVMPAVTQLSVETPSWGYGNSGTRFKVFPQSGVPRNPFEKVEDAATIGRFTGVARSIALHIPWDRVDDYSMLTAFDVVQKFQFIRYSVSGKDLLYHQ